MNRAAIVTGLVRALSDVEAFSHAVLQRPLRPYQVDIARAILRSVEEQAGRTITVMMPHQSGKNETSAQLEAYLLTRHQAIGGSLVKAAPMFKPQIINSIQRLTRLLGNPLTAGGDRRTGKSLNWAKPPPCSSQLRPQPTSSAARPRCCSSATRPRTSPA